jgi:hypothetical protein
MAYRARRNVEAAIEESMTFGFHQGYVFVFVDLSHTSILYCHCYSNLNMEYYHSN